MRMTTVVLMLAGVAGCLRPATARAQTAPAGAAPAQAAPAATGAQPLGSWWEKSSLSYNPVPEQLLFHVTSDLTFSDSRGNTHGTQFGWQNDLVIRKRRLTDRVTVDLRDTDMVYGLGGGSADYQMRTLRNHVEYDLTKNAVAVGGIEHMHNTLVFLDRRVTVYGGGGVTLFDKAGHKLDVIGGLGYAAYRFQREEMARINPVAVAALPTTTPGSGAALVMEGWQWKFSDQIALKQDASYLEYFHQDLGELWTFNVSVDIPVTKHLSIGPRYTMRHENNIYIEALGVEPLDRTFSLGVKFSH
jgi:hypothetical protein